MANETIIDSQTARRLLLILSLEGDVKREEIEWALGIIHQIPGYAGITIVKAVRDDFLREVLVAIAAEQISPTTPKDLKALIEAAEERKAALKTAKEAGEKRAEEFIEAAEKAAKTKAPAPEEPVSFGIKITPAALKAFGELAGKAAGTPFKLVSFFSPARVLAQTPQTTAALASAMSLSQISAKAEGLPEGERKQLLRFVENLREAEFSFYAQVKLQRTPLSVGGMTILMGPEFGMTQGEVVALVHGGAPSEKGPSFIGGIGQQIFGGLAQKAVTKAATKAVTSALTKTGVSITAKTVAAGAGTAIGGPVGTAIGLAVGWVVDKVVGPLINKVIDFISKNKWVLATPFVLAGLIFGLPWLTVGGVVLGGFLLAGGVGPALSMAGGFASSVIGGIASLTVASIATPLIVALISIPVLTAIILFIINSGAYLVPPAGLNLGGFSSPYVEIIKTPNPPGPFQNSDLPKEIVYTINIKPKKGALANVKLTYDCKAISKANLTCPDIVLEDQYKDVFSKTIDSISAMGITFTYKSTYDSSFKDSAIIDSVQLSANVVDEPNAKTEVSASVTFGTPPISCPVPGAKPVRLMNYSYNSSNDTGHGSTTYWKAMGGTPYRYALPLMTSCNKPSDCSYYGYAYDVFPTGATEVFAPTVEGKDITWQCSYGFSNGSTGYTYICIGTGGEYSLVLTHMASGAKTGTIKSGEKIGKLFNQAGNTHLHIEFQLNGRWQKPENYFCK